MIKALGRRGARMLLTAAALLAGVTGIALATIPGAGGIINGCFEKRTGLLRVIDADAGKTCTKYENPISWNQQGPKGEPGPAGPAGAAGVSRAVIQRREASIGVAPGSNWTLIFPLVTPLRDGGKYLATADLTLRPAGDYSPQPDFVRCRLFHAHGPQGDRDTIATTTVTVSWFSVRNEDGSVGYGHHLTTASLSGWVVASDAPSTLSLECGNWLPSSSRWVYVEDATLTAIQVDELAYNMIVPTT